MRKHDKIPPEQDPRPPMVPFDDKPRRGSAQTPLWDTTGSIPRVETTGSLDALQPGTPYAAAPWETTSDLPRIEPDEPVDLEPPPMPQQPLWQTGQMPPVSPQPPVMQPVMPQPPVEQPRPVTQVMPPVRPQPVEQPRPVTQVVPPARPQPVEQPRPVTQVMPPARPQPVEQPRPVMPVMPQQPVEQVAPPTRSEAPVNPFDTTADLPRIDTTGSMPRVETTGEVPLVETTGSLSAMDTVIMRSIDEQTSRTEHVAQTKFDWFKRICQCLLAVVIVAGTAFAVRYWPSETPEPAPQEVSSHVDLTCPVLAQLTGTLVGAASGAAQWQTTVGAPVSFDTPVFTQPITSASTLSGDGSLSGLIQYVRGNQLAAASCAQPSAAGYLQVLDADATLVLTNPDPVDAVISVYLMGPDGDITVGSLVDLRVPAESTITEPLGNYAEGVTPLGVTWQSTIGRVVAWIYDDSATALDIVTPTTDDTEIIVPAVTPGDSVNVLLTNPGTMRATVSIGAITADGTMPVIGGDQVLVEARTTVSVDVTSAVQDQPIGLLVQSDRSVVATAVVKIGPDTATIPGVVLTQQARTDMFGAALWASQLVLSSDAANLVNVSVTITTSTGDPTTQTVALDAGTSQIVNLPAGQLSVRVHAATGVVAALIVQPDDTNPSGISIVRLPPDSAWHGVTRLWVEGQPH